MATNLSQGSSHISGRPLTNSKHEHFAHLVTKGESPARAYVLCGYSERRDCHIQQRIENVGAAGMMLWSFPGSVSM